MFVRNAAYLVVVLLGFAVNSPARAAASSSIRVYDVNVQLIDVDPSDGVTPSMTPNSAISYELYLGMYNNDRSIPTATNQVLDRAAFIDEQISLTSPIGSMATSLVVPPEISSLEMTAELTNDIILSPTDSTAFADVDTSFSALFFLSANTQIVLTLSVDMFVQKDSPLSHASSFAGFQLDSGFDYSTWDNTWVQTPPEAGSWADSQQITLTLTNNLSSSSWLSIEGEISLWSYSVGGLTPPPVPEPGTWVLMLAGLGTMVWLRGRNRRGHSFATS